MKKEMILDQNLSELKLSDKTENTLRKNDKNTIKDVWAMKRKDLKGLGFSDSDIMQIVIKLQLQGLDINRKIY